MRRHTMIWIAIGVVLAALVAIPRVRDSHPRTSTAADRSTATENRSAVTGRMRGRSGQVAAGRATGEIAAPATKHLALNTSQADWARLIELGYNVFDVGPNKDEINSLPKGGQAMVWVGAYSCDGAFEVSYDRFTGLVDELGRNPKVYGWYLADEPDPKGCPAVVPEIRRRADYVNAHAPDQVAFISATDYEYRPLRPANTHVDLIGLDPYPCRTEGCDLKEIDRLVKGAVGGGIPRDMIVPVIQTFGQECSRGMRVSRMPSETELRRILAHWRELVPEPALEISYSWGRQDQWACPTLSEADGTGGRPDLQSVMRTHNRRPATAAPGAGRTGSPSPAPDDRATPRKPAPADPSCPVVTVEATPPSPR